MAYPSFFGDPSSGVGFTIYADGTQLESTLEEYSNGRFYISGGSLIDNENLFAPTNIGQQGAFTLQRFAGGGYNLVSQTTRGSVNRSIGPDYLRMISGALDVGLPSGETLTLDIDPTNIAKVGRQWVAYQQEGGGEGFTEAVGPFATTAEVQAALGSDYRLASPSEAIYSAVLKRVLTDNAEALDRIIEAYGIDTTDKQKAQYNAATKAIELGKLTNIQTFSSYLFD